MPRLRALWESEPTDYGYDTPEAMFARFYAVLAESAASGAVLAEVRVGNETIMRPETVVLFRAAEAAVRDAFPAFRSDVVAVLKLWESPDRVRDALTSAIAADVGGIDLLYLPYDTDADWTVAYRLAEIACAAGLGVTVHAGEFSTSNIAAALDVPGVSRIGHAVHAIGDNTLLSRMRASDVAVECCLTSNVQLGAVATLKEHPLPALIEAGVPIVFGTDNPLQFGTTIRAEYGLAHQLGLSKETLLDISEEAVKRSFVSAQVKAGVLEEIAAMARR